jgi:putative endonuclease
MSSRIPFAPFANGVRDLLFAAPTMSQTYCVYTLASRSRNLYTGVTDNLERRMIEHREGLVPGFTTRYKVFRLVHFELFGDVRDAIARDKEIKGWRREKKIWLIKHNNPNWQDLAAQLPTKYHGQQQIPHPRSPKPGDRVRDDSAAPRSPQTPTK